MNDIKKTPQNITSVSRQLLFIFLLVGVFSIGYFFGFKGYATTFNPYPKVILTREQPEKLKDLNFNLFWTVWDALKSRYYDKDKLIEAKMVYGAIKGMVAGVGDPYTIFLDPQENKVIEEDLQGGFEGVGIQIGFKGTQLAVVAPLKDSPAETAGIKAGDLILAIKDATKNIDRITDGITLPEAVQAIRGKAGTRVTLTLLREGTSAPFEVEVTRASIDVPNVTMEKVGDEKDIALITVNKFAVETKDEWDKAVVDILKDPAIRSVIVDLRNNPGGLLDGAVDLSGDFLEIGDVAVIEEYANKQRIELKVQTLGRLKNYKTAVLINEGSASASEIMAGALRDHNKAQLVGTKSFGKGTIQESEVVEGGAGLHITVAKWLTPNGTWVNDGSLKPDHEIEDNADTPEDEQLQKAIEVIKN